MKLAAVVPIDFELTIAVDAELRERFSLGEGYCCDCGREGALIGLRCYADWRAAMEARWHEHAAR